MGRLVVHVLGRDREGVVSDESLHPDDPLPKLVSELDQAAAFMPNVARAARAAFDAFIAEGFTASQAVYLTAVQITENDLEAP